MDDFETLAAFKESFNEIAPGVNSMAESAAIPGESYIDTISRIMSSIAMTAQQVQLMRLNIERARAGQSPIDISAYSGIGVNVGLSSGTQQLVMYGGLALLAILALRSLK
jgi:hypothetical protein